MTQTDARQPPRQTVEGRRHIRHQSRPEKCGVEYRGYFIVPKRDFGAHGYLVNGDNVRHGYVVTDGGIINEMPGAAWFLTTEGAMRAVDDLISAGFASRQGEHPFWALNRFRREAEEHAPELALLLQGILDVAGGAIPAEARAEALAILDQIDANCDMRSRRGPVGGPWTRDGERVTSRFAVPAGVMK